MSHQVDSIPQGNNPVPSELDEDSASTPEGAPGHQERRGTPESKWVPGITADQPVRDVAGAVLQARLRAVWHWLPLAADRSEEDCEYVHQLRVATRRAMAALRVFFDVIPDTISRDFRTRLQQVRLAADEARDLDVLGSRFSDCMAASGGGIVVRIADEIGRRRQAVQSPIVTVCRELAAEGFEQQIDRLLAAVRSQGRGNSMRRFGRQAGRYLKPVLKKFFQASQADLSSDEHLHALRIRSKRLRYTMEIVAVAFDPDFREKLYPRISLFQDLMGTVNDRATAKTLFRDWLAASPDAEQRAFLAGLLLAEAQAHEDLRRGFLAFWTPQTVVKLRRQFRLYTGLP